MTDTAFSRTELMLGTEGLSKLKNSFVVLAGAGAVGGFAMEALVRAGVGHIRIVDFDTVEESNLNRQILATRDTLGKAKVDLAKARAESINPNITIETVKAFISPATMPTIFAGSPDVIVDAIDTITAKVTLLKTAVEAGVPVFSSMGAALRKDISFIKIAPLSKTKVCPLAAAVRAGLRKEGIDLKKITAVYSEEEISVVPELRNDKGKSILGSLPTIPAIFGLALAGAVIDKLTQQP